MVDSDLELARRERGLAGTSAPLGRVAA